jgi:peptidoglycan/LPS O-acetylase OafA/YrhL
LKYGKAGLSIKQKRLTALDGLRFLLMLHILLDHYFGNGGISGTTIANSKLIHSSIALNYGVSSFAVLSGFVLAMAFGARIAQGEVDGKSFAVARFASIVPGAWVMTVLTAMLAVFSFGTKMYVFDGNYTTMGGFLADLLFVRAFDIERLGDTVGGAQWFIGPLLLTYLLFYVITRKWGKGTSQTDRMDFVYFISFLVSMFILVMNYQTPPLKTPATIWYAGFFTGCATYSLWRRCSTGKRKFALTAVCVFVEVACWLINMYQPQYAGGSEFLVLGIAPSLVVIAINVKPIAYILSTKLMRKLGELSYSMLLTHAFVFIVMMLMGKVGIFSYKENQHIYTGVYIAVCIAVAFLFNRFVERPMNNYIRRKYAEYANAKQNTEQNMEETANEK